MKLAVEIILAISIITCAGCCDGQQTQTSNPKEDKIESHPSSDFLKQRNNAIQAIETGDTSLYDEASSFFMLGGAKEEFYFFALRMANEYNYAPAYQQLFIILSRPNNGEELKNLDIHTQRLAKYYLLKAFELTHDSSMVKQGFPQGRIPLIEEYSKLE